MTDNSVNDRELILGILLEVNKEGSYSHIVIRNVLDKYRFLDQKERSFIKCVSEGTIERRITLDYIISGVSSVKPEKMKPVIREILRMSVYQMKYMDQIPVSAICNEAVKLTAKKGFRTLKGFVNGVLRNIARKEMPQKYPNLSIEYSMPDWIVKEWIKDYGRENAERMLAASVDIAPTTIRTNLIKNTPEELAEILKQEGIQVKAAPFLEEAFIIEGVHSISSLKSFQEGRYTIQDISSMLVGKIADVKEGMYVIDMCAAPGGKAFHVAEQLHGTGRISARDLTDRKTAMLTEGKERLGLTEMEILRWDACEIRSEDIGKADLVIADLPCSGLGVLSRKKDLKYRVGKKDLEDLKILQQRILDTAIQYLKPGGMLVYSTCTVNPGENIDNYNALLQKEGVSSVSIEELLPEELKHTTGEKGYIQLLQGIHPCDGFFISKIRK